MRAESRFVAPRGAQDLVVVDTNDAVLVAHKEQVQCVQNVVEHLKGNAGTAHLHHMCLYGPWGYYEGIDSDGCFQAKRITVKRGEKLSLQMHHHHAELCIVVSGSAHVTCGEKFILLAENKSTYVPLHATHRLEKPGRTAAAMIEVQSGKYLGQDNIVRLEDIWQRARKAVIRAFQLRSRCG